MKQHKLVLITTAFLLAGAGTVAAGGAGQVHASQTTNNETAGPSLSQLYEFKVTIAGEEIQLPISYKELKAKGWTLKEEALWEGATVYTEQLMVGGFDLAYPRFYKGNMTISAVMINAEETARNIQDLEISELNFSLHYMNGSESNIVLPGNIVLGSSTEADIMAAYGKPTDDGVGDGGRYHSYEYKLDDHQSVYFYRNSDENKVIDQITLTNQRELYRQGMEHINNFQRSADVLAYTVPSGLGTNIAKGTFQIEGDLYQFPAPLAAFIDNGWQIQSTEFYLYYLDPGEERGIELNRNGKSLNLYVRNDGTIRGPIQNCFTSQIYESLTLPGGVQTGISRSALLKALHNTNYTVDGDNREYKIKCEDQKHEISIHVDDYDNQVIQIIICPISQEQ